MKILSSAFDHNGLIPSRYTCDGLDCNPPLEFKGVPLATCSLVLIMDDPDVPESIKSDRVWDHWIVFNIPPTITSISENGKPIGILGTGTSGNQQYHGPCPPDGEHRYFFKLYALDIKLDLSAGVGKEKVEQAMMGHVIDSTELIGRYSRPCNAC